MTVQLIGMLDSPYVRRVAISLRRLGLPFEHRPISVFRQIAEFREGGADRLREVAASGRKAARAMDRSRA